MTVIHYIGTLLVLLFITALGLLSGRRVKTADDFATGNKKAGAGIVAGLIIGTLVGGSSTIGTAQLAYTYGFSAWWFTLGGGIGCLFLGGMFTKRIYNSNMDTIPQILSKEYGQKAGTIATLLTSFGSFLSIVAQVLSGIALITSISSLGSIAASIVVLVLMLAYVMFGGIWGAGYVGIAKTVLMYLSVGICGVIALSLQGGWGALAAALPAGQYFSLTARGAFVDIGAGLSLLLGVLSTQAYFQAVISARSLKISRTGVLLSALLIPLIGIAGIFVGMYMKINYPDINSASALPIFIMQHIPPFFAGAVMAILLVAVVGTGAGIALGIGSMFCNDIYKVYFCKSINDKKMLRMNRIIIAALFVLAVLIALGGAGSLILSWSFMSMGLRGAVAFGVLCTALFFPGRVPRQYAIVSMVVGPVFTLAGKFILPASFDPLFLGVGVSMVVLLIGLFAGKKQCIVADKKTAASTKLQ